MIKPKKMLTENLIIDVPDEDEEERQEQYKKDQYQRHKLIALLITIYLTVALIHYISFFTFHRQQYPDSDISSITFITALYSFLWPFFGIVTIPWMIVIICWEHVKWFFFAFNESLNLH